MSEIVQGELCFLLNLVPEHHSRHQKKRLGKSSHMMYDGSPDHVFFLLVP
jgi:hypothetical protein